MNPFVVTISPGLLVQEQTLTIMLPSYRSKQFSRWIENEMDSGPWTEHFQGRHSKLTFGYHKSKEILWDCSQPWFNDSQSFKRKLQLS